MNTKHKKVPEINLIVAMTESGLVGDGDKMPWKSSLDFKWLKQQTMGYPMIFGRTTAQGMKQFPLKNRPCAIVTNRHETYIVPAQFNCGAYLAFGPDGFYDSLGNALRFYQNYDKIFIAGGVSLYKHALQSTQPWIELIGTDEANKPLVDRIIKTTFPDGLVTGDKYLDTQTLAAMSAPNFESYHEERYRLHTSEGTSYYESMDTAIEHKDDLRLFFPMELLYEPKPDDTLFPEIRFEILNRVHENPGK
jgi:dihydrofolate reductase